jgi:hypothetical protein
LAMSTFCIANPKPRTYDAHFLPAGAEANRRDLPNAGIHLLDAGPFALEPAEIGALMRDLLRPQGI